MQFLLGTPVTRLAGHTMHSRRVTSRSCTITDTFLIVDGDLTDVHGVPLSRQLVAGGRGQREIVGVGGEGLLTILYSFY